MAETMHSAREKKRPASAMKSALHVQAMLSAVEIASHKLVERANVMCHSFMRGLLCLKLVPPPPSSPLCYEPNMHIPALRTEVHSLISAMQQQSNRPLINLH